MDVTEYDPAMAAVVADAVQRVQAATCLAPTSALYVCAAMVVLLAVMAGDVLAPAKGPRR